MRPWRSIAFQVGPFRELSELSHINPVRPHKVYHVKLQSSETEIFARYMSHDESEAGVCGARGRPAVGFQPKNKEHATVTERVDGPSASPKP